MELKDSDGARADFSRAIELDPKSVRAYTGRGMALQSKNELIAAHKDFGKAIELDPKVASAYRNRGENLYRLALDPRQNSLPEADDLVRECHTRWLAERVQRAKQLPWQPIICGARDLPRPAAIMQGAQVDFQYANRLEKTQSCEERPNVGNGGPTEGR
jgi:tetratricopeptide (TPR) repeat protein